MHSLAQITRRDVLHRASRTDPMAQAHIVARESYAWPGGYLLFLNADDGGVLCPDCVRAEIDNGWRPMALDCLEGYDPPEFGGDPLFCDHCGRDLFSL